MKPATNLICNLLAILCIPVALTYYIFIAFNVTVLLAIPVKEFTISPLSMLLTSQIFLGGYGWVSLYKLFKERNKNTAKTPRGIKIGIFCGILSVVWHPLMLACATPAIILSALLFYSRAHRINA